MLFNCSIVSMMPITFEKFICKRPFLLNQNFIRHLKTIPKFHAAKKMLEKFKRDREMKIYKERILTVPNILTISRITVSPLFPWLVINGHMKSAFALLAYCGATDIVIFTFFPEYILIIFLFSSMVGLQDALIKNLF